VLIRLSNGARGVLYASQISVGEENGLTLRVYGTRGAIEWRQECPETLIVKRNDQPRQLLRRNWAGTGPEAAAASRIPAGHPEGFIEAFANIYSQFADAVWAKIDGIKDFAPDFPTVEDGLRGMAFIENVVRSSKSEQKWIKFEV